jgi:hypothetical protein
MTDPIHSPLNKAASTVKGKTPVPGVVHPVSRPASAASYGITTLSAVVAPKQPLAPPVAQPVSAKPATTAVSAAPAGATVTVPLAALKAMHDQLVSHAAQLAALLPAGTAEAEAALAAQTAARLKQQPK